MKINFYKWTFLLFLAASTSTFAEDRYDYCRDKARDISGYYGSVPAEYEKEPSIIGGAFKGAAAGVGLGWLSGGDKKALKKAAKRTAGLGMLIAGIKKSQVNEKRRINSDKRRRYEVELNACMMGQ